jgi:hypothetical protein
MEINEFLKLIKSNLKQILLFSVLGLIAGIGFFNILPDRFVSEGTIYVFPINKNEQTSEVSNEMNYARNIIGLSETPEFKDLLRSKELVSLNYIPLIGVSYGVKIKEVTPNLVSLTITGDSIQNSEKKFESYFQNIVFFKDRLNQGNSSFEITKLQDKIISYQVEKNFYLYSILGLFCGFNCGLIYVYLRKAKK